MTAFQGTSAIRQKKRAMKQWLLGTACRTALMISVVFLGISYVMQTSAASTKGYDISDLQRQIRDLENEHQRLQFRIATYRSMASIEERLQTMNFVAADDTQYLATVGTVVARR